MTEARFDRLLAACLHQGIFDVLPQRLDFYEHWLRSETLRDGNIGPAAMLAVLGFLRTEGEAYDQVVTRAGHLAAEWTIASMPPLQRRTIALLPRSLRARAALRVAAKIVRMISTTSRVSTQMRGTTARLEVNASPFCAVRERQTTPLCGFYSAVAADTLTRLGMPATARVEHCHAVDGTTCVVALELTGAGTVSGPAMAA